MNFVIVTPGYYPHNGAESYCATRFASALAKAGHCVHVVTSERDEKLYKNSYDSLLNAKVMVTRVRRADSAQKRRVNAWSRMIILDPDLPALNSYITTTREVLGRYKNPILITRAYPWLSLYVGWACRRYASKWVQHFSDPMLDFKPFCRLAYVRLWSLKFWMRRAMRHADAISVTCKRVKWYYREQLGPCVDKAKFILATHIGDFKLDKKVDDKKVEKVVRCPPNFSTSSLILHDGDIYGGRGLQILDAIRNLNEQGVSVDFIQGRRVKNDGEREKILATPHCYILDENASDELRARAKTAQVSFVADFNMEGLSYSTHLMSKFVYQLFTDKPIVVLSKLESEKHDYCVKYPEAGFFFADMNETGSLEKAIMAAFKCDLKTIDRARIRERFSEEHIAVEFIEQLNCDNLNELNKKWMRRI